MARSFFASARAGRGNGAGVQNTLFFDFGPFTLRMRDSALLRDGQVVQLRFKVFETLRVLVEEHGHIIGRSQLLERVWPGEFVEESGVTQNISLLRRVLDPSFPNQRPIETVSKKGYRFAVPVKVRRGERSRVGDSSEEESDKSGVQKSRSLIGQVLVFYPSQVADAILAAQGRTTLKATLLPGRPDATKVLPPRDEDEFFLGTGASGPNTTPDAATQCTVSGLSAHPSEQVSTFREPEDVSEEQVLASSIGGSLSPAVDQAAEA